MIESIAQLRFLGRLGGLYPDDSIEAFKVDSIIDSIGEISGKIEMSVMGAKKYLLSDEDWTKDQVLAIRGRIASHESFGLPFYMKYVEDTMAKNKSGWLVGDKISIADLRLYSLVHWIISGLLDGIPKDTLDKYPLVKGIVSKIDSLPEVIAYRESHPMPYGDFDYKP